MPVSARCVEQAIPSVATLDWGGKTPRRQSERKSKMLSHAGPRSLSAHSARPPQSRAGSPTHLAGRTATVVVVNHSQGKKKAHTARLSRWGEPCP
jgi:hypothetical protein